MNGQFIKSTIICIGIIIGLSASGFLLVRELSAVPITYASGVDSSGNLSNKNAMTKNISGDDSIYSNFFSSAKKQIEPKKQEEPKKQIEFKKPEEPVSVSETIQPEPIKIPVKKAIAPRATSGTKCPAKGTDHASSSNNKKNHMDEDCCSDYDEWPKPGCAYTAKDFGIMLPGPASGHVKHK